MSHERREEEGLPDWLWFFIALLGVLGAALLYRRRREMLSEFDEGTGSWSPTPSTFTPRYVEPDSIPIDVRLEGEALADEEDDAFAGIASPEEDVLEVKPPIMRTSHSRAIPMTDEQSTLPDAAAAAAEYKPPITQVESTRAQTGGLPETSTSDDDLTIIEGIGPAISSLLKGNGITTFRALADAPTERLDEILNQANLRRIADPGTWSEQAQYAAEGRMNELTEFQRTLKAGRRKE